MNLANKTFKNNSNDEVIKVIDSFESIVILENKGRIDLEVLMSDYTEIIDPKTFLENKSGFQGILSDIKNIPSESLSNLIDTPYTEVENGYKPSTSESAIIQMTEEEERAELVKKYGASIDNNDIEKQQQAFDKILNPEKVEDIKTTTVIDGDMQDFKKNVVVEKVVENPILSMFKSAKRNVDFDINIELVNKIPRIDFIEMMEDTYDISIIDFLADEITNNLLKDPSEIRNKIRNRIDEMVSSKIDKTIKEVKVKKEVGSKKVTGSKKIIKK